MAVEAQLKVKLESVVHVNQRYKTLFYGLKKNHPHSAATIHPLIFLARRIAYAAIVLFLLQLPIMTAYVLCWICLGMLAYTLIEQQWEDSLIMLQHVVNEVALYLILLIALTCGFPLPPAVVGGLGWTMISTVLVTVVFNLGIISYIAVNHGKRFC